MKGGEIREREGGREGITSLLQVLVIIRLFKMILQVVLWSHMKQSHHQYLYQLVIQ